MFYNTLILNADFLNENGERNKNKEGIRGITGTATGVPVA